MTHLVEQHLSLGFTAVSRGALVEQAVSCSKRKPTWKVCFQGSPRNLTLFGLLWAGENEAFDTLW